MSVRDDFSAILFLCRAGLENRRNLRNSYVFARLSARPMWNQLCSCEAGALTHGIELSGVETGRSDDDEQHAASSDACRRFGNQPDPRGRGESEERAASGARHSRAPSQCVRSTVALLTAAGDDRGRRRGRAARRKSRREIPARRRHYGPGRPEQQADRRAAGLARADVPETDVRSP